MQQMRTERLAIRVSPEAKALLLHAAETQYKSLSDFVLDTVVTEAESVLAEKRYFSLSSEAWDAFQTALDAPPQSHARMQQLLTEPSVFDE